MKLRNKANQTVKANIAGAKTKQDKTKAAIAAKNAAKAAKQAKADKVVKETAFEGARLYKAWKRLCNADYQFYGEGAANLRGASLEIVDQRKTGQDFWITKDAKGYGFLFGKQLDKNTMQSGNSVIKLVDSKIAARFTSYSACVKYVESKGEKGVKGIADYKALSTGAQYSVYASKGRLCKYNSGNGTGNHAEYKQDGARYAVGIKVK